MAHMQQLEVGRGKKCFPLELLGIVQLCQYLTAQTVTVVVSSNWEHVWAIGCPGIWLDVIAGSVRLYVAGTKVCMSRLSRAGYALQCGWVNANLLRASEEPGGGGRSCSPCGFLSWGICCLLHLDWNVSHQQSCSQDFGLRQSQQQPFLGLQLIDGSSRACLAS